MANIYRTVNGDTWDMVAKSVYNDETKADYLMENNPKLLEIFIFGVGTEIIVPNLPKENKINLPPWRK